MWQIRPKLVQLDGIQPKGALLCGWTWTSYTDRERCWFEWMWWLRVAWNPSSLLSTSGAKDGHPKVSPMWCDGARLVQITLVRKTWCSRAVHSVCWSCVGTFAGSKLAKKNLWKLLKSQEHIGPQDLNPMVEHGHQPITPFTRPLVFFTTGWLVRWLVVKVMSPCSFCLAGYLQSASFHPELLSNLFKMGYFLVHHLFFAKPFRRNALANSMPFWGVFLSWKFPSSNGIVITSMFPCFETGTLGTVYPLVI